MIMRIATMPLKNWARPLCSVCTAITLLCPPVLAIPPGAKTAALPSTKPSSALKADPVAYALLKDAHDHRETFSPKFAGMAAQITLNDNGKTYTGKVSTNVQDAVTVTIPGASSDATEWVNDQMENLIGHRRGSSFAQGEGKDPITFGANDHSPLGRQVLLHDSLQSSYRVRDHQLIDVTRTMMGQKFSITVLESIRTNTGKYLPHQFMVTFFDEKTGSIDHVDAYTDTYAKINGAWLPLSRRIITAKDGGFTTRSFVLTDLHVVGH